MSPYKEGRGGKSGDGEKTNGTISQTSFGFNHNRAPFVCPLSLALPSERSRALRKFPGPWAESAGS